MIVGFSGKMKSGKDTCSDFLTDLRGFKRIAFADNLKRMCMHVFGLTEKQCYTQDGKERKLVAPIKATKNSVHEIAVWVVSENYFELSEEQVKKMDEVLIDQKFTTPREILQFIGTEVLRHCIVDDFHAQVVENIIKAKGWDNVVISDCRFPNEVKAIESWGGRVINIDRPQPEETTGIKGHASENSLEGYTFDHEIKNDGSLEDLKKKVLEIVDEQ
jgi:hypothetical protein